MTGTYLGTWVFRPFVLSIQGPMTVVFLLWLHLPERLQTFPTYKKRRLLSSSLDIALFFSSQDHHCPQTNTDDEAMSIATSISSPFGTSTTTIPITTAIVDNVSHSIAEVAAGQRGAACTDTFTLPYYLLRKYGVGFEMNYNNNYIVV
jgi:hypothetical protein